MGGEKEFQPEGGFSEQNYSQVGTTENGIKIIAQNDGRGKTPTFSNTPRTTYAKLNSKGQLNQISIYGNGNDGRGKVKDIDIGHIHKNRNSKGKVTRRIKSNEIHVHEYDSKGNKISNARKPSKKERRLLMIARYGKRK